MPPSVAVPITHVLVPITVNYDSFCMAAAAAELRESCLGTWVDQAHQPEPLLVSLAFTGRGPRRTWLMSADARWPRAHFTARRRQNPDTPPGFCQLLRKHLGGSHLTAVEQVRFDRILRLTFQRGAEERVLVHEVMGRHSNVVLLDEGGTILGAVKIVPPAQTRVRPVLPGHPYVDPPGERPDPRALSLDQLRDLLPEAPTPEAITRALSGWGTFAAREALARGGEPAEAVFTLMERVRERSFDPRVLLDEGDRLKGVWAFPSVQAGWTRSRPEPTVSAACDTFYGYQEEHAAADALRKTVTGALERTLKTARLQLSEATAHLEGIGAAELLKIKGELLAANASTIERGAEEAELPNWYDPEGGILRVGLDPELDARENSERYFHRYRRATAAAEAALERIPELEARVAELEARAAEAQAADEARLPELLERVKAEGLLRAAAPARPGERPETSEFPSGVRVKRVPVGAWEIYYGENATSNDHLTTRWAKPNDLWLHARAINGAHVVVRNPGPLERLPPDVLKEAARIAAAHSEAKHSSLVAVDYTLRKYVRKPRGSAPGFVTYTGEKTLHVEPELGVRRG